MTHDLAVTPQPDLSDTTAIVVGASRGLGHGITTAFADAGARVVAVARTRPPSADIAGRARAIRYEIADAADASVAARLLDRDQPDAIVLVAGARPLIGTLQQQSWEAFSVNWQTDVKIAFHWLREALLKPLRPDAKVIIISSGAALQGSPLSGGYAGAKATQRFMTAYARDEASRSGLGIVFTAVLPRLTPLTDLGRPAVAAYAERSGQTEQQYLRQFGEPLTPAIAGTALVALAAAEPSTVAPDYLLTGDGLTTLGAARVPS
jgi:NAD(P)-dependent dehydrogenase (short-subunit alcohol dehydrogenase family)